MLRRSIVLLVVVLISMVWLTGLASAQAPIRPFDSDPSWHGQYWNNLDMAGTPNLEREDADLNFNWGAGSPGGAIGADLFSARWTRYIYVDARTYRFTTTSDDGVRLYVDDVRIINDWSDHPARTQTADRALTAGHHLVRVEYYERGGQAVIQVGFAPIEPPITGWRGEYFNNTSLSGAPAVVRDDAGINFNWGAGAPAGGIGVDNFSVRWTRNLSLAAGTYRFTVSVDDGVRLWVNNHLLIDKWQLQAETTFTGDIYVSGATPVKMEYFEQAGQAVAKLSYVKLGGGSGTPPPSDQAIIVDENSPNFQKGGTASSWRTKANGYGGSLLWTYNNDYARPNYNWAHWKPALSAGRYEVFVYIPSTNASTHNARYWVSHRDGYTLSVVNQMNYSDQWVSLGTFYFRGTSADYVSLADVTFETYLSRMVAWDAVMWAPR